MNFQVFLNSITQRKIPEELSQPLLALWYDGCDDWDRAHDIAQDIAGKDGSVIHAYLHRKEGDQWNAGYWYRKAGEEMPQKDLKTEWEDLVRRFLET